MPAEAHRVAGKVEGVGLPDLEPLFTRQERANFSCDSRSKAAG